jgi:hypothetical protein
VLLTHVELKGFEVEFLCCHNSFVFVLQRYGSQRFQTRKLEK